MYEQSCDITNLAIEQELLAILSQKSLLILTQKEKDFINKIKTSTDLANKNNITRTKAYLSFYSECPEVHWAFLAHMVSRNGGYNMTDVKSSLLVSVLSHSQQVSLFQFLERANALIFHDAFPQLLLYKKSKEDKTSYFHLLPSFSVSKFMIPIWSSFLNNKLTSKDLSYALITNEQQYVEKHLMSLSHTKQSVLQTFTYIMQEALGFTHVIFPYKKYSFLRKYSLAGVEVRNFHSVQTRIQIGKKLYHILFSKPVYSSIFEFAKKHEHSGSRSDYWPHEFSLNKDQQKIISPSLTQVWENVPHHFPKKQDWYTKFSQIQSWKNEGKADIHDITKDVKRDLSIMKSLISVYNIIN